MPVDGRHARRDRNRVAVLEATLALFREGDMQPRADRVAARAGVSLRSLYRYYPDNTQLIRAAMDHNFLSAGPFAAIPDLGAGTLDERIERCVTTRLALYEALAPMVRMARAAALHHEVVRVRYDSGRELLRNQIERHFAPELETLPRDEQAAIATAVDLLCQLDAMHYLLADRALTPEAAAEAMTTGLTALLQPLRSRRRGR